MSQPKNWLKRWPRNSERQMQINFNTEIAKDRSAAKPHPRSAAVCEAPAAALRQQRISPDMFRLNHCHALRLVFQTQPRSGTSSPRVKISCLHPDRFNRRHERQSR